MASVKNIPWFVAARERDFGRRGAITLAQRLRDLSADVHYQEYPDVEHMVIVQAALDDLFSFTDKRSIQSERP